MSGEDSTTPARRVPRAMAERILATAADIDAVGDDHVDLEELRQAAQAAGISTVSFDLSVSRVREDTALDAPSRTQSPRRVSYAKAVGSGALGVLGALAIVAQLPFPEAGVPAALMAGAGSIGAILAYLRSALEGERASTEATLSGDASKEIEP